MILVVDTDDAYDFACRRNLPPMEVLDSVMPPPGCSLVVTVSDVRCMFEEVSEAVGHAHQVTAQSIMLAIAVLRQHAKAKTLPILCGDLLDFRPTYKTYYALESRARALERLLGDGFMQGRPYGYYHDIILTTKTTVLLPYNVGHQYLLFELILRGDRGRLIKVWDGGNVWGKGDPKKREEVLLLLDVFYGGDSSVPVYVWEKGDPRIEQCHGAGAFLFLCMCYRVLGFKPQDWGPDDEAVARSHMWSCILNCTIGKVPQLKL